MKSLAAVVLLVSATACAAPVQQVPVTPPPQPQAQPAETFDPVGVYDFTTEVQGTTVAGVLRIRRGEQGLAGSITSDITGELPLQQVTVTGRRGELRASTAEGALLMVIDFAEGNRITGGWELSSGLTGTVAGQRRPPQ